MKIIYYLKNLKISKIGIDFVKGQINKLKKFLPQKQQEEALVEVELSQDKEIRGKEGIFKAKFVLDLPKKSLIIARGVGKNLFQAIQDGFKKLKRQLRKNP